MRFDEIVEGGDVCLCPFGRIDDHDRQGLIIVAFSGILAVQVKFHVDGVAGRYMVRAGVGYLAVGRLVFEAHG